MRRKVQKPYEKLERDCMTSLQWHPDPVQNIATVYTLTAIIQGVIELANQILDADGIMGYILRMVGNDTCPTVETATLKRHQLNGDVTSRIPPAVVYV
jgi:hypothetical protein